MQPFAAEVVKIKGCPLRKHLPGQRVIVKMAGDNGDILNWENFLYPLGGFAEVGLDIIDLNFDDAALAGLAQHF